MSAHFPLIVTWEYSVTLWKGGKKKQLRASLVTININVIFLRSN